MHRRALVAAVCVLLLVGGCSGKKKNVELKNASGSTTTTAAAGEGSTTTAAPAGAGSGAPSTTAASRSGTGGGNTTTTARSTAGTSSPPPTGGGSGAGAKPGTYSYALSGTGPFGPVSGDMTVVEDPAVGQDQHSSSKDSNGGDAGETTLHFQSDGVYLKDLKLSAGVTKEWQFNPLALAIKQPPTVGSTWQWGPYTSTDGATKVSSSFKILREETINAGSEPVPCVVVEVTVTTTGDINTTSVQDIWASAKYNLTIQEHDKVDGSATIGNPPQTYPVHSDTTRVLHSTTPK